MQEERIGAYIQKRLEKSEGQKDLQAVTLRGRLSIGIDSKTHGNLPAWLCSFMSVASSIPSSIISGKPKRKSGNPSIRTSYFN